MKDARKLLRALVRLKLAGLVLLATLQTAAAPPVFKCSIDGAVTYQHVPCAAAGERPATPTVQQLNAQRLKRQRQAASAASAASAAAARTVRK